MANLEIYTSSATSGSEFVNFVKNSIKTTDKISSGSFSRWVITDSDGNEIPTMNRDGSYSTEIFYFNGINTTGPSIIAEGAYISDSNTYRMFVVPVFMTDTKYYALYSSEEHPYTAFEASGENGDYSIFGNFRILKYITDDKIFLSFGTIKDSITISTYIFKQFDDPTKTKNVLIVTDSDGYVTLYDGYTKFPWIVHSTTYNNVNTGYTSSINAYRYSTQGYYCDDLYYFDGGIALPGDGISKMGNNKFLKMGNSNFYIKME